MCYVKCHDSILLNCELFGDFEILVESNVNSPANEILLDIESHYNHSKNLFVVEMTFWNLAILDQ